MPFFPCCYTLCFEFTPFIFIVVHKIEKNQAPDVNSRDVVTSGVCSCKFKINQLCKTIQNLGEKNGKHFNT